MLFSEILKAQGLSEAQVKVIVKDMRSNRIFITYEEKIEERYQKMKLQRDSLRTRLGMLEILIEDLYKTIKTNNPLVTVSASGLMNKQAFKKDKEQSMNNRLKRRGSENEA